MKTEEHQLRWEMTLALKDMETQFLLSEREQLRVDSVSTITDLQIELQNNELEKAKMLGEITDMAKTVVDQEKRISNLSNDVEEKQLEVERIAMDNNRLSRLAEQNSTQISALMENLSEKESLISTLEVETSQLLAANEQLHKTLEDNEYYASSPELMCIEPDEPFLEEPRDETHPETGDSGPTDFFTFVLCTGPPFAKLLVFGDKLAEGNNSEWKSYQSGAWIHICTTGRDIYEPGRVIGAVRYSYTLKTKMAKRWFPAQFSCGFLVDGYAYQHFMDASIRFDVQDCVVVPGKIRNIGPMYLSQSAKIRKTLEETLRRYIDLGSAQVHQGHFEQVVGLCVNAKLHPTVVAETAASISKLPTIKPR